MKNQDGFKLTFESDLNLPYRPDGHSAPISISDRIDSVSRIGSQSS